MDEPPVVNEEPEFYTVLQMAALLNVHEFTVRRRIWAGDIKAARIGPKILRIPKSELRRITSGAA